MYYGPVPAVDQRETHNPPCRKGVRHLQRKARALYPICLVWARDLPSATSQEDVSGRRDLSRRVNPEDVAVAETVIESEWPCAEREFRDHRAFSFEDARSEGVPTYRSEDDLYS